MNDAEDKAKRPEDPSDLAQTRLHDTKALSQTIQTDSQGTPTESGGSPPTYGDDLVGKTLGKYEIRSKLGQGGMGVVLLGYDPMIEREVAIKVLPPSIAAQPTALERFLSEARATGKLNHPNVVSIFDISSQDGLYYLVMELLQGGSVADLISDHQPLEPERATEITLQAAAGLAAAHRVGLVHRDIKPENLMLAADGTVKVVDFGLSKLTDASNESELGLTTAGQIVGTPFYMSPEQIQAIPVDARSDVYSLGGTYFTLLTGEPPFSECKNLITVMAAHTQKAPPDPRSTCPRLPLWTSQVIETAMAKSPDDRFSDASEMRAAIERAITTTAADRKEVIPETLERAVLVEPSKMQAMMLQRAVKSLGVGTIDVVPHLAEAREVLLSPTGSATTPPSLVVSAQELPDGTGDQLFTEVRQQAASSTALVLHTNDVDLVDYAALGQSAFFAVASKRARPNEWLATLLVCSPLRLSDSAVSTSGTKAQTTRFVFVSDGSGVAAPLATLIRNASLLDCHFATFDSLSSIESTDDGTPRVLVAWRHAGPSANDASFYAEQLQRLSQHASNVLAVQIDGDQLWLRGLQQPDFQALTRVPLDVERIQHLSEHVS